MSDIIINIHGGNNQILPNATEAVQNFYGTGESVSRPDAPSLPTLSDDYLDPAASRLIPYLNNKADLEEYLIQLQACQSASELARIILDMCSKEDRVTPDEIVKDRFISLFLPLVSFTGGKTVNNIRARINDALSKRPRKNEHMFKCQ